MDISACGFVSQANAALPPASRLPSFTSCSRNATSPQPCCSLRPPLSASRLASAAVSSFSADAFRGASTTTRPAIAHPPRPTSRRVVAAASDGSQGGGDVENAGVGSSSSTGGGIVRDSAGTESGSAESRDAQLRDEQQQIAEILAVLQQQLKDATAEENYREAARLRDAILDVRARDPVRRLQQLLEEAVAKERYEAAALLKDELQRVAPPPLPPAALPASACNSDTVTESVRVCVRSVYVRHRSDPPRHFFFAYRVRITNEGSRTLRLISRHWRITNGQGRVEHVRGAGVVGQQPVLPPGASFEYTSVCPLDTRKGAMEGEFEMLDVPTSAAFTVKIGAFVLDVDVDGL